MSYLHGVGVIHRDLKGENCMITDGLGCAVADLGEARGVKIDETMTAVGVPLARAPS